MIKIAQNAPNAMLIFIIRVTKLSALITNDCNNNKQHIGFVLNPCRDGAKPDHVEADANGTDNTESQDSHSISLAKELGHD